MINKYNIVEIVNNQPMTTSLRVAEVFNKNHCDILRSIKNLKCSRDFNESNFALVEYIDSKGEQRPCYNITKDGFVFLTMGFTGEAACQFKELYIRKFNEMEQTLKRKELLNILTSIQQKSLTELKTMLKDVGCLLTWDDIIELQHKKTVGELCYSLVVNYFTNVGNISNCLRDLESNQFPFINVNDKKLIKKN